MYGTTFFQIPVVFSAYANSGKDYNENTYVKGFNGFKVNYGPKGFDLNTGVFTAPINGIYEFSFAIYHYQQGSSRIEVEKNNVKELSFTSYAGTDDSNSDTLSATWYMKLYKNDKIQLKVLNKHFYSSSKANAVFNGKYLRPI